MTQISNTDNGHPEPSTVIDPDLVDIYKNSDYRVFGDAPFVMRIGLACPPLQDLLMQHDATGACFVSAYNPRSEQRSEQENAMAQHRLRDEVAAAGWSFIEGVGEDPQGHCPGEPCLLVLGVSRQQSSELGRRYGQNAVLWAGVDGIPELVLTR